MTPTDRFARARNLLLSLREDQERACREFAWPAFDHFNWALDWFDVYAERNGRTALQIVHEERGRESRRSFQELADHSARVANALRARGVQRGDRILLMLPNVPELWEVMLAAIKLGAVTVPTAPQLTRDEVLDRVLRGRIRHLITDSSGAQRLQHLPAIETHIVVGDRSPGWLPYEELLEAPARFLPDTLTSARDPLLLYFTSGTSSLPKLVLHTHTSYPVGHLSTMYWLGIREGDIHQNMSAPGWAKHAWSSFFAPWNAGATIFVHEHVRFRVQRTIELLRAYAIDTFCAPPNVWRMLIAEALGSRPPRLREIASAGAPLSPEVIERVRAAWSLTIRDGYGQTETTALIGNCPGQPVQPGAMGRPLPGYEIVLLDSEGREAADGEVAIKLTPPTVGLMAGYLDLREQTEVPLADTYYRTGDQALRQADGNFLFIGRTEDIFKSSDYRVRPFELESLLLAHPAVAEAAVIPSPDPLRLAVPKAFLALHPGYEPSPALAEDILNFTRDRVAPYKRIRRLQFAELPKTASGKIRLIELRRIESELRRESARADQEYWIEDFSILT